LPETQIAEQKKDTEKTGTVYSSERLIPKCKLTWDNCSGNSFHCGSNRNIHTEINQKIVLNIKNKEKKSFQHLKFVFMQYIIVPEPKSVS